MIIYNNLPFPKKPPLSTQVLSDSSPKSFMLVAKRELSCASGRKMAQPPIFRMNRFAFESPQRPGPGPVNTGSLLPAEGQTPAADPAPLPDAAPPAGQSHGEPHPMAPYLGSGLLWWKGVFDGLQALPRPETQLSPKSCQTISKQGCPSTRHVAFSSTHFNTFDFFAGFFYSQHPDDI